MSPVSVSRAALKKTNSQKEGGRPGIEVIISLLFRPAYVRARVRRQEEEEEEEGLQFARSLKEMAAVRKGAAPRSAKEEKSVTEFLCAAREREHATTIAVGSGVKLEARVMNVRSDVAVIFCPALPPGGNMYIPEIGYLQGKLGKRGYATVRFNFRGVGSSEGDVYFRSAQREMEDVRDVARWLLAHRKHFQLPPLRSCWLVGVSYGSVIASAAAAFDEFDGYVAVAYPANYLWYCTSFDSKKFSNLAKSEKPKLYIWGNTDVFAGKSVMDQTFEALPEPKTKFVVDELDSFLGHYFRSKAHLDQLDNTVKHFLETHDIGRIRQVDGPPNGPKDEKKEPLPTPVAEEIPPPVHHQAIKEKKGTTFGFFSSSSSSSRRTTTTTTKKDEDRQDKL